MPRNQGPIFYDRNVTNPTSEDTTNYVFSHVQSGSSTTNGSARIGSLTLASYPKSGNILCLGGVYFSGATNTGAGIVSILDGSGNIYTVTPNSPAANVDGAGQGFGAYMLKVPNNADRVINVTFDRDFDKAGIWIDEFSLNYGTVIFDADKTAVANSINSQPTIASQPIVPLDSRIGLMFAAEAFLYGTVGSLYPWTQSASIEFGCSSQYYMNALGSTPVNWQMDSPNAPYSALGYSLIPKKAAFGHVQGNNIYQGSAGSSLTVSLPVTPTPGNVICLSSLWYKFGGIVGTSIVSILDANGNSYTSTPNSPSTYVAVGGQIFTAYTLSAPANAHKNITFTFTDPFDICAVWADEFYITNGTKSLYSDVKATGVGTSATSPTIQSNGKVSLMYAGAAAAADIIEVYKPWTANGPTTEIGQSTAWIINATTGTPVNFRPGAGAWTAIGFTIQADIT